MRNWQAALRPHWTEILLTATLIIVGAIVGAAQVLIYIRQAHIMSSQAQIAKGQLDEMQLEGRAWVTADIRIIDPIDYDVNGTHIGLLYTLRNTGKIPALGVAPYLRAIPSFMGLEQAQREQCAQRAFGGAIFPGDERAFSFSTDIPKAETEKFWTKYPTLRPGIYPILLMCIVYRMPGESAEHHTPFIFKIVRGHSDIEGRGRFAIFVDEGRVPVENLQLIDDSILAGSGPD